MMVNNLSALHAVNSVNVSNNRVNRASESLASGSRINRARNDAAGLAVAQKMEQEIGGINQAIRNANDGISLIQTTEGALDATHGMLGRLHMLSVQASNGLLSSSQRSFIQMEVNQILSEINRVAQATDFNGIRPLNGSLSDDELTLQIGTRDGEVNTLGVSINSMTADGLGLSGLSVMTASDAMSAIDSIREAIGLVSAQRGSLGASQNRLEHTVNSLVNSSENTVASMSRIADTDMASAMIDYTKNNILKQVSISMIGNTFNQQRNSLSTLWQF
jgi:flagellin